jgi:hypothetical protein
MPREIRQAVYFERRLGNQVEFAEFVYEPNGVSGRSAKPHSSISRMANSSSPNMASVRIWFRA